MDKRFRVAFSFAAETRDFVAELARILANRFGADRIFYDQYHEAELARPDLVSYLPLLYSEHTDLVVAVLCEGYEKKEWCGLEWGAIYHALRKGDGRNVLLMRFDQVEGAGVYGLAGFVDVDHRTPEEAATIILERLALNEGHLKDHYLLRSPVIDDWPMVAPPLDWLIANQVQTLVAFEKLITQAAPYRLLLARGASETGKSSLGKQFLRNALKIPHLTCGRFDFKGSFDIEPELRGFAERLGVPTPTPGIGVPGQLDEIFRAIRRAARPTLLIFDTFELAGAAERWVNDLLLPSLVAETWLRVIILGQRVPLEQGETWSGISQAVELHAPTPEEWFAFGQRYNSSPDFTLEFVRSAHQMVKGKSSVLAQLCGPVG